jgi:hypothetical protein
MPRLKREITWAALMLGELLLLAGSTFLGSALLRFPWFEGLFRIPDEQVLVPLFLAAFLAPLLVGVAALYWLGAALLPILERSPLACCGAHFVLVAAPAFTIGFSNGPLGFDLLTLGSIIALGPRILFARLRPWAAA